MYDNMKLDKYEVFPSRRNENEITKTDTHTHNGRATKKKPKIVSSSLHKMEFNHCVPTKCQLRYYDHT